MRCGDMMDYVWTWTSAVLDVSGLVVSPIIAKALILLDLDI
jgi:hypothetical protein